MPKKRVRELKLFYKRLTEALTYERNKKPQRDCPERTNLFVVKMKGEN
jgi:hypothetical protein